MCNKRILLALLLVFAFRAALTAPAKEGLAAADSKSVEEEAEVDPEEEEEKEDRGLERQLLTTVFGIGAEAGVAGLALPALATFSWRQMLLRGLFMLFQMMMRNHH